MADLPIEAIRRDLETALRRSSPRILLTAPPGSGKSTTVPFMMREAGLGKRGTIIVVQPRRMAARLLARYTAQQRGIELGNEVGYIVRFERRVSKTSRVIYMTDGVLERWMTENPTLSGVEAVVFDEFHERRLSMDLALGRLLDLQERERPDLALIIMSATLETTGLQTLLGDTCRILQTQGRTYPVEIEYCPAALKRDACGRMTQPSLWEQAAVAVVREARRTDCGSILVFMPGAYEIRKTVELLAVQTGLKGWDIMPLHGSLSPEKQNEAVVSGDRPRVIVATNVAETSLTIEGVRTVVDSGLAREAGWDARRGMNTLSVKKISQASAEQRAGRAGRVAPGRCIRLWSQADQARRPAYTSPEVLRVDLSSSLLILKSWGIRDPRIFRWLTPPPPETLQRAESLLQMLGAVTGDGQLTPTGRAMLQYPLPPRLAKLLAIGRQRGCFAEMAAVAALLQSEPIALNGGLDDYFREKGDYTDFQGEWRATLQAEAARFDPDTCSRIGVMARACREVVKTFAQLTAIVPESRQKCEWRDIHFERCRQEATQCLAASFLDSLGMRHGIATNTCRLTGGRSGRLASHSVALRGMHFAAAEVCEVVGKGVETRVSRCTLVELEQLAEWFPDQIHRERKAVYDREKKRVVNHVQTLAGDLLILDKEQGDPDPEEAAAILADLAAEGELKLDHWDDSVEQWIRRLNGLREWMPELELPSFTDEDRLVALSVLCEGAVAYRDIKTRPVLPVLCEWLSPWQRELLDRWAPVEMRLENGQRTKIRYAEDNVPFISQPVQKLFGVLNTPRIADNRVAVKVEILAPNRRPWQITSSLESFWKTGYPQMRKDLAGRYPKHQWPQEAPGV